MDENITKADVLKALAHFEKKVSDYQLYVDKSLIEMKKMLDEWVPTLKGEEGEPGTDGKDGKSAFEIAIENGFSGTEADWLKTLIGKDGKDGLAFADIVILDTHTRNYDTENWKRVGTKGYNTDWGDVKNRNELQVGQTVILPGYNTETQSPIALLGEVTEIAQYSVWVTSLAWFSLKNLKGASIIEFDTDVRTFSSSDWETYGTYGRQTRWDNINNKNEFRAGDIGILRGINTATNDTVLCFGEVIKFEGSNAITKTIACIQSGSKGDNGREVIYHKLRDTEVNFELKKGRMYTFTVSDEDSTSAYIVDKNGKTVTGVAGKTLDGLKNGLCVCADRCSGGGLTGRLSLSNLEFYKTDRWDWDDGYREQYGPYYLKTTSNSGIDIWEI